MDRTIFLASEDFIKINSELLKSTGFCLYFWRDTDKKFVRLDDLDFTSLDENEPFSYDWFVGEKKDEKRVISHTKETLRREERKGLITLTYGGEHQYAIGATRYSADNSNVEKIVNRELNKLFKKYAQKGVLESNGTANKITDNYYWTEKALSSGKNWRLFLGRGVREKCNSMPGFTPKP